MVNTSLAIIFIIISSIFGSFGTLFFKVGAKEGISLRNYALISACSISAISFFFYILALQQAPLTFIYLTASVSYIWAVLLAKFVLHEKISKQKIIGISFIIVGILVMNL